MQRTGYQASPGSLSAADVGSLALRWSYTSAAGFVASPLAVNGVIYVVDQNGNAAALSSATGSVIWQRSLGQSVTMTPLLYDNELFIGTHTTPGTLYALDPSSGATIWSAQVPGAIRSSPVVVGSAVFIGSATGDAPNCIGGGVFSFDVSSGAQLSSWLTEPGIEDGGAVWAPISTDGSSLYFGTGNTCVNAPLTSDAIVSIDPSDLLLRWDYLSGGADYKDDDVGSGVMISNGVGYAMAKDGYVYANSLSTGKLRWKTQLNTLDSYGGFSTPTSTDGTIAVDAGYNENPYPLPPGSPTGGTLFGLNTSGGVKWSVTSKYVMLSSPVATPDMIFAELDNSLQALDPATGKSLWSYATQGAFKASPAVVISGVYAADLSGVVYAFGVASGASSGSTSASRSYHHAVLGVTRFVPSIPRGCMTPLKKPFQ